MEIGEIVPHVTLSQQWIKYICNQQQVTIKTEQHEHIMDISISRETLLVHPKC